MDFIKMWHKLRFTLVVCWKLRESSTSFQNEATENGTRAGINTELFFLHFSHMEKGQSSGGTGWWVCAFPPSSYCWDIKCFEINVKVLIEATSAILENTVRKWSRENAHEFTLSTLDFVCKGTSKTSPLPCLHLTSTSPPSLKENTVKNAEGTFHSPNYSSSRLLIVCLHQKSMFGSSTIYTVW